MKDKDRKQPRETQEIEQFQFPACDDLAKNFVEGPARVFLHPSLNDTDEQINNLADLIRQAAWVSFMLWRQRAQLNFAFYEDLKNTEYALDLEGVNTYREQEFPETLMREGAKMDMIVQPRIVASWIEDEEPQKKVWGQPLVLWTTSDGGEDKALNNMEDSDSDDNDSDDFEYPDSD
ncbi:hypothetical protein K469DRAFT_702247 [Zopfia rhizophila CBS 207.26]|uniref:Uncharacterized protein n=1 Tax=Zopfia rhizophila CBS 207.26 TaxID=1314779 RepID=A0A6A6D7R7_9PEZI|nr:hypothetical protein K469DRAFT_702247 [Zopfia rhizophila CBS 207.26]